MTPAATPEMRSWRKADHTHERPVKWASPAPTTRAPTAPRITVHSTAVVPEVTNQGNRGTKAPRAKVTKDDGRRLEGFARLGRIDAQLLPGMGLQGDLGVAHHLGRQFGGHRRVEAPALVDGGQLLALVLGVVPDGLPLDVEFPQHELGLRSHRDVLTGGHREGSGHQPGDTGQPDGPGRSVCSGHAQDEGDVGNQTVAQTEHGGPRSPALEVAMTVLGHEEQRTEGRWLRTD